MYFNVVVRYDEELNHYTNQLVFHFGEDLEKAKEFSKIILQISGYYVEIIPILDKKEV